MTTDRKALIRLAASRPVGDPVRRVLLGELQKGARAKMIRVPGGKAYHNIGYSKVIAGEPDEVRRGNYGTAARVGREWFSVNLIWSERQMRNGSTPYTSQTLGIDPRLEIWGVRGPFHGEP